MPNKEIHSRGADYHHQIRNLLLNNPKLKEQLVEVKCLVCGEKNSQFKFSIRGWELKDCTQCGFRFISPRGTDNFYHEQYGGDYFESKDSKIRGYFDYKGEACAIKKSFQKRWNLIKKFTLTTGQPKHLDVGCALGFGIEVAMENGFDSMGLDISEKAIEECEKKDLKAHHFSHAQLETALETHCEPEQFDVITCWDVLEHVGSAEEYLACFQKYLKPNGVLSIIVPDRGSLLAKVLGRQWAEYQKVEEHIFHFREKDLEVLLKRNGFTSLNVGHTGKYASVPTLIKYMETYFRWISYCYRLLGFCKRWHIYVNPWDKLHVLATNSSRIASTPFH